MIDKITCGVTAFNLLVCAIIAFLISSSAKAEELVFVDFSFDIPTDREDGSPLQREKIKSFRIFKVVGEALTALTPDIIYPSDHPESISDVTLAVLGLDNDSTLQFCAKTIDTNDRISECGDIANVDVVISSPDPPGGLSGKQSVSINITIQ